MDYGECEAYYYRNPWEQTHNWDNLSQENLPLSYYTNNALDIDLNEQHSVAIDI